MQYPGRHRLEFLLHHHTIPFLLLHLVPYHRTILILVPALDLLLYLFIELGLIAHVNSVVFDVGLLGAGLFVGDV